MNVEAFRERFLRRAEGFGLSLDARSVDQLAAYYDLLIRWNRRINLTALPLDRYADKTLDRLLIEPLFASRDVEDTEAAWFDLGSGSGSPAIPLKIVRPRLRLTMVESRSRKAAFLSEVVRALELSDAAVEHARVEDLSATHGRICSLVTVRALKIDEVMLGRIANLVRTAGRLFLFGSSGRPPTDPRFRETAQRVLAESRSILRIFERVI